MTKDDTLIYNPNYDKQIYPFYISSFLVEKFGHRLFVPNNWETSVIFVQCHIPTWYY